MSADGISTIGAAAVTTIGTLAVTGAALKAVGKTTQNMNHGSSRRYSKPRGRKSHSGRKSSRSKSMLGF